MAYVASDAASYAGKVVGDGQCVAFVKEAAKAPQTSLWGAGAKARDSGVTSGTAVATFDADGGYGNHTDGRSHAACMVSQSTTGLVVYDQWVGHAVALRTIRFKGGEGTPNNDGDAFKIID